MNSSVVNAALMKGDEIGWNNSSLYNNNSINASSEFLLTNLSFEEVRFESPMLKSYFVSPFLFLTGIFGIISNVITIIVLKSSKDLKQSPFTVFITSLCVSDLVSALNGPAYMCTLVWGEKEVSIPAIMCRISVGTRFLTEYVTIQHILIFSILRLIAAQFPHHAKRITVKIATIIAIFIWIEVFFIGSLVPYISTSGELSSDCNVFAKKSFALMILYGKFAVPTLFFVPMIGIIVCGAMLVAILLKMRQSRGVSNNASRTKMENNALIQITLIVASFLIGYSGITSLKVVKIMGKFTYTPKVRCRYHVYSYLALRTTECLNPLFYNLGSSQLRKATMQFLSIKNKKPSSTTT